MDIGMIVLRLIHISCGVFWAGTLIFVALFLEPSVREAGPGGARVMQGLMRRGYLTAMPVIAALTLLTGIDLLRRASAGFQMSWFGSGPGIAYLSGGVAAIVAFTIGMTIMRPGVLRSGKLMQSAQEESDPAAKDKLMAQVAALRSRNTLAVRWVAVFLSIAVVTMSVGRYLN